MIKRGFTFRPGKIFKNSNIPKTIRFCIITFGYSVGWIPTDLDFFLWICMTVNELICTAIKKLGKKIKKNKKLKIFHQNKKQLKEGNPGL